MRSGGKTDFRPHSQRGMSHLETTETVRLVTMCDHANVNGTAIKPGGTAGSSVGYAHAIHAGVPCGRFHMPCRTCLCITGLYRRLCTGTVGAATARTRLRSRGRGAGTIGAAAACARFRRRRFRSRITERVGDDCSIGSLALNRLRFRSRVHRACNGLSLGSGHDRASLRACLRSATAADGTTSPAAILVGGLTNRARAPATRLPSGLCGRAAREAGCDPAVSITIPSDALDCDVADKVLRFDIHFMISG